MTKVNFNNSISFSCVQTYFIVIVSIVNKPENRTTDRFIGRNRTKVEGFQSDYDFRSISDFHA